MAINIPPPGLRQSLKTLKNPLVRKAQPQAVKVGDWSFEDRDGDLVVVNDVSGDTLVIARSSTRS